MLFDIMFKGVVMRVQLDTHYDSLEHDVKQHNAQIYWFSKKNITLPLLETEASESNKFLMNTAVSNQGKIHWNIEQGIFTAERQIKFLRALRNLIWRSAVKIPCSIFQWILP